MTPFSILNFKGNDSGILTGGAETIRRDRRALSEKRSGDAAGALSRAARVWSRRTRSDRLRRQTHGTVSGAGLWRGELLHHVQYEADRPASYSSLPHPA